MSTVRTTALQITSYEECREVLRSPDYVQTSKQESAEFVGGTVLTLDGQAHRARRRLEAPIFAPAALRRYELSILEPTIRRCLRQPPGSRPTPVTEGQGIAVHTDLVGLVRTIFLQLAAATIGLDGVDSPSATARLAELLEPLLEGVTVEWSTRDHAVVQAQAAAARDCLSEEFFIDSWARRHEAANLTEAGDLPPDLLQLLARHKVDQAAALREVILFLAASTLNNAALVTNVVHELHAWVGGHPEDHVHLTDAEFLRGAMVETLRLHVPTPALFRQATADVVLQTGQRVRRGGQVALDLAAANRDPAVFGPSADRFDPRRHPSDDVPTYGLTFGAGVHVCLGRPQVLGSYVDRAATDDTATTRGMLLRVLQALFDVGITPDQAVAPTLEQSVHRRFSSYPVVLGKSSNGERGHE